MTRMELERWIQDYGREIYSFCRYLTGSGQEADELYQDTFVKAAEQRTDLDIEQNLKGYLLSTAMNLWKNRKRKFARRNRIAEMKSLDDEGGYIPESSGETPEETLLRREEAEAVYQVVKRLTDKYRAVIILYYMEDMSLSEIAGILKIPVGTVKSRLYKAREILKKSWRLF